MRWNHFLFFFFVFSMQFAFAGNTCSPRRPGLATAIEMAQFQCEKKRSSPQCQDLYQKIKDDGGDVFSKRLRCEVEKDLGVGAKLSVSYISCIKNGVAGIVGTVQDLGKVLGESAAKFVISVQKNNERLKFCDSHPEVKTNMFSTYNASVPKLMKIAVPTNINTRSCAQLESDLYHAKKAKENQLANALDFKNFQKNPQLTADEKAYLDFKFKKQNIPENQDFSLIALADKSLKDYGIQIDCYNLEARAALRCEALFTLASLAVGGGKLALSALSGLKADRFAIQVSNLAQEAGSLKNISEAEKLKMLASASRLSNEERVKAARSLLGRKISEEEQKAIVEAHQIGLGGGGKKYSAEQLKQKANLLQKAGFNSEERSLLMRSGITGEFDEYVKSAKIALEKETRLYRELDQSQERQKQIETKLKSSEIGSDEKSKLQIEHAENLKQMERTRTELFDGSDALARAESRVGHISRQIEIAQVNGADSAKLQFQRAQILRNSAEIRARGSDFTGATREYRLAAQDIEHALEKGLLKTYQEKVEAIRILQNAALEGHHKAIQDLASEIASSIQKRNGVVNLEKLEFPLQSEKSVLANQPKSHSWDLIQKYRDQNLRKEILRSLEDMPGQSRENIKKLGDQSQPMIEKSDKMRSEIESQLRKEQGSHRLDYIHRLLEELEIH